MSAPYQGYDGAMSASVVDELAAAVGRAVAAVGGDGVPVRLDRPADPEHGDYATAVALQLAKPLRAAPREIAARIAAELDSDHLESVDVAGPGFLNLRVSAAWYRHAVERILTEGPRYGSGAAARPQRIQVEYVSGNPTGPVTVATARNAAYGDSLARLFEFAGHDVGREYYFNDAGRQIDLFGESLQARARGAEPPADGYHGEYVAAMAAELGLDPEADAAEWARAGTDAMIGRIRATLARFRCSFDNWFLERSLYESGAVQRAIDRVRAGGHVYEQRRRGVAALVRARRRQGPRARALGRHLHLRRRRPGLHRRQARARLRHGHVRARPRPPRLRRPAQGGRPGARLRPRPHRRPDLPARAAARGQDVEAGRADRHARRPARRDRRRRRPLRPGAARPRPADRSRHRAPDRPERREPGLLLPVRARADRGDPAQGRRRRGAARPGLDARAGRDAS